MEKKKQVFFPFILFWSARQDSFTNVNGQGVNSSEYKPAEIWFE